MNAAPADTDLAGIDAVHLSDDDSVARETGSRFEYGHSLPERRQSPLRTVTPATALNPSLMLIAVYLPAESLRMFQAILQRFF
jgi:hypothetical protein